MRIAKVAALLYVLLMLVVASAAAIDYPSSKSMFRWEPDTSLPLSGNAVYNAAFKLGFAISTHTQFGPPLSILAL